MYASGLDIPSCLADRVGYLLVRCAYAMRHAFHMALAPLHIIPPVFGLLTILKEEGSMTQRQLGSRVRADRTTITLLVDELEKKRLVTRSPHPTDRRAHLVKLTPRGVTVLHKASKIADRLEKTFLNPLSPAEQKQLTTLLKRLYIANVAEEPASC